MMPIDSKLRHQLKQRAHHLRPVVTTGNAGLTESVLAEIDRALSDHELVKVRLNASDREEREQYKFKICEELHTSAIQSVGHVVTFYRKKSDSPGVSES